MTVLGRLLSNRRAGESHLAWNLPNLQGPDDLILTSRHFSDGGSIPQEHCAKHAGGDDRSPQLAWSPPPSGTAQLLLVVEDIDVPMARPAVHCVALIDPSAGPLEPGALAAKQPGPGVRVLRSTIGRGYHGPAPTGHTGTRSRCSPSRLPSTTPHHRTGQGPAPSCPPSPQPSSAAAG
ncbi:YbhB/YbcL family Raf kinase inhibitor-like protein [Streptomyces sp. NPDC091267]|uniref:YbhB/YbcL family Raf kinase inhibitor-like protein n=1 Tax=Streptomyces sp. NPDC091267 TaxID=3155195 RepID=UPI00341E67D9